jgi:hypothetical protein
MRDEHAPYDFEGDLPVTEVGDFGSFEREPEYGDDEAREPELERLDLTADEPGDVELDVELVDDEPNLEWPA